MDAPATNPSAAYEAVRDELIGALQGVGPDTAARTVPGTPAWTVKDVAAHLCGLNAELLAEVSGGLGSDEATSRQVGDRGAADLGQVLDEWRSLASKIRERLDANQAMATALLADLVIHAYDLAEVLDQPTSEAQRATPASAHRYVPLLQKRIADQASISLTIDLTDGSSWTPPVPEQATTMTLRADPKSFLQGVTGRLRRSDVEAFDWSADPTHILDNAWNQYGTFRT